jgi:hypothetical protein
MQIGTKMEVQSSGPGFGCFNDKDVPAVAIENSTYKQSGVGKAIAGHYLVVLACTQNYPGGPRWVITQQAFTTKPE